MEIDGVNLCLYLIVVQQVRHVMFCNESEGSTILLTKVQVLARRGITLDEVQVVPIDLAPSYFFSFYLILSILVNP